jgi:hypothetical protein
VRTCCLLDVIHHDHVAGCALQCCGQGEAALLLVHADAPVLGLWDGAEGGQNRQQGEEYNRDQQRQEAGRFEQRDLKGGAAWSSDRLAADCLVRLAAS